MAKTRKEKEQETKDKAFEIAESVMLDKLDVTKKIFNNVPEAQQLFVKRELERNYYEAFEILFPEDEKQSEVDDFENECLSHIQAMHEISILSDASIYYTNGKIEPITPRNGSDFTLEEVRSVIAHGVYNTIELVHLYGGGHGFPDLIMLCNEDGKLIPLSENINATRIYFTYTGSSDIILGNVIICTPNMFL